MNFNLIIISTILSCAFGLPVVERNTRSTSSSNSILTAITGATLLNEIINDISILQLYRQRMYDSAKSICETFTQTNTNSTPTINATCSGNASSVVVNSLRTSSCSWINSVSSSILPECKSHLQEVDLTCHEIQLADLAYKVTFTLTGSNSYRARENLDNWVSRFVDPNQMSKEAFRLITRRIH